MVSDLFDTLDERWHKFMSDKMRSDYELRTHAISDLDLYKVSVDSDRVLSLHAQLTAHLDAMRIEYTIHPDSVYWTNVIGYYSAAVSMLQGWIDNPPKKSKLRTHLDK